MVLFSNQITLMVTRYSNNNHKCKCAATSRVSSSLDLKSNCSFNIKSKLVIIIELKKRIQMIIYITSTDRSGYYE